MDGSQDVLRDKRNFSERINTCIIIRKDSGIFNAYNNARSELEGDYVLFLNSGDTLATETVLQEVSEHMSDTEESIYFGQLKICGPAEDVRVSPETEPSDENWIPHHPAMFFPGSFVREYAYDESYWISGDRDYKLRALTVFPRQYLPLIISSFNTDGLSSSSYKSIKHALLHLKDRAKITLRFDPWYLWPIKITYHVVRMAKNFALFKMGLKT